MKPRLPIDRRSFGGGYLLLELALALLVLAILARASILASTGSVERLRVARADEQLAIARESLVAHLVARGRLPCPIDLAGRTGDPDGRWNEGPCMTGQGLLPADVLGVPGRGDGHGGVVDPWGRALHYAVDIRPGAAAATPTVAVDASPDAGASTVEPAATFGPRGASAVDGTRDGLTVCRSSSTRLCGSAHRFATDIAAIVWSNGPALHDSRDESENRDGDSRFVHGVATPVAERAFDDRLVWLTRLDVAYWRLRAGWSSAD